MQIADFQVRFQLTSPKTRTPRASEDDIKRAFPTENVHFLGSGTFGDTWRVGDRVVKLIMNEDFPPERIEREIEAAGIEHPNVVHLEEVLEVEAAGETRPALAFAYVKGVDLATKLAQDGPITDEDELRALAIGLFSGLAACHDGKVIHRDIKPENVQLRMGKPSRPVLLDLGLAHVADLSTLTTYPAAIGTRAFMPPEVLRGERAVRRSDVYAAAVTFFIAATGTHPWLKQGQTVTNRELIEAIVRSRPRLDLEDETLVDSIELAMAPKAYLRPEAAQVVDDLAVDD